MTEQAVSEDPTEVDSPKTLEEQIRQNVRDQIEKTWRYRFACAEHERLKEEDPTLAMEWNRAAQVRLREMAALARKFDDLLEKIV